MFFHFSIAYIGPSVTPYTHLNPGYRIYEVDGDHENSTQVRRDFSHPALVVSSLQNVYSQVSFAQWMELINNRKKDLDTRLDMLSPAYTKETLTLVKNIEMIW